jgi:hypothetical protein
MRGKKYSWLYGVLASLITLAMLFGGQALFNKYAMAKPMDKMFEHMDGIERVQITFDEPGDSLGKIEIALTDVDNLQVLYVQILAGLDKYGGAKKYNIVLKDTRDAQLEDFYYQIHYFLEEARDNKNFAAMAEKIQKKSAESGIRSKIYVDAGYIYLQAEKKSWEQLRAGNQLYIVLARSY